MCIILQQILCNSQRTPGGPPQLWNHLSTAGRTFRGEKTSNGNPIRAHHNAETHLLTWATCSLNGWRRSRDLFGGRGWYSVDHLARAAVPRNHKSDCTAQTLFFPLAPRSAQNRAYPRGRSKRICDNVVEVILSTLPCLLSYPLSAAPQKPIHNDRPT